MTDAAREQLAAALVALEEFRGHHYRLPESLRELEAFGYAPGPAVEICAFRRIPDPRRFDEHVRIALRHRASSTALVARYPQGGEAIMEVDASTACKPGESPLAATEEAQP